MTPIATVYNLRARFERAAGRHVVEALERGEMPVAPSGYEVAWLVALAPVSRARRLRALSSIRRKEQDPGQKRHTA